MTIIVTLAEVEVEAAVEEADGSIEVEEEAVEEVVVVEEEEMTLTPSTGACYQMA